MTKFFNIKLILICMVSIQSFAGNTDRAGEAGAYELLINGQARTMGMYGINSASVRGVDALGSNIAGLAYNKKLSIFSNYTSWLTGTETNVINLGVAGEVKPGNNIGFSVNYMNFGKIPLTTTSNPEGIGTFSPYMLNLGFSFARKFGRYVRGGTTLRMISEGINNVSASGFSVDAGLQYTSGTKDDIHFGVFIRNLGFPMRYSGDGIVIKTPPQTNSTYELPYFQRAAKFELPAQFSIALSKDFFFGKMPENKEIFCKPAHRLSLSGNFIYNAFIANDYGIGAEYSYHENFAFRIGYLYEQNALNSSLTMRAHMGLAAGISYDVKMVKNSKNPGVLEISYNYRPTWIFNGTHNIGFTYYLAKSGYCDDPHIEKASKIVEIIKEKPVEVIKEKIVEKIITKYDTVFVNLPTKVESPAQVEKVNKALSEFATNIEFKTGTNILTNKGLEAMSMIGEVLKKYPQGVYSIKGHTDNVGSMDKNMNLSKMRAKTVAKYLTEIKSIPESSLDVQWFGSQNPIDNNNTDKGRQRNRRVEIIMKGEEVNTNKVVPTQNTPTSSVPKKMETSKTEELAPSIESPPTKKTAEEEVSELATKIKFKPGTDSLTTTARKSLDKIISILKEHPNENIKISSHVDNGIYPTTPMEVSKSRAETVVKEMKSKGIPDNRVKYEYHGDSKPIDNNTTETGRSNNRRIEIQMTK